MSAMTIAISLVASDLTAGAFASLLTSGTSAGGVISKLGKNFKNLSDGMKVTALTAVAAAGAFDLFKAPVEYGIGAAAELETELVRLKNALQDDTASMGVLSNAVNDLAIRTVFSSSDASNAFEQLVEMGYNAQQVMYGMDPAAKSLMDGMYHAKEATQGLGNEALTMAQAMKTDAVTGAKLLGAAVHMFAQEGLQATDAADQLAGAFLNGVPSATNLLQALNMAGAGAATAGVKMSDFLTILDLLAQNGMSASSAGASLNYMFQSLTAPIQKQAKALAELGIMTQGTSDKFKDFCTQLAAAGPAGAEAVKGLDGSVTKLKDLYDAGQSMSLIPLDQSFMGWATSIGAINNQMFDAQGHFIGMKDAILKLDEAMSGMTTEQKLVILGDLFNVRSGRAAKVLTNMQDFTAQYDKIAASIGKVDVNTMAEKQLETLQGSWEAFGDSFKSLMANIFLPILPHITAVILKVNDLIQSFVNLPEGVRVGIAVFLIVGMVVSGLIALIAGAVVTFSAIGAAMAAVGVTVGMLGAALGIVVGIIAGVIALALAFKGALESNKGLMEFFSGLLATIGGAFGVLWEKLQDLWTTLQGMTVLWNVLKVVLAVIAVVIVGALLLAVLLIIGVFIALVMAINGVILGVGWLLGKLGEFFGWVFGKLGDFKDKVVEIFNAVVDWIKHAWNTIIEKIGDAIQWIKDTVHNGLQWVQDRVGDFVNGVVNFFSWLYDHNYYFQWLVDRIRELFTWIHDTAISIWQHLVEWISGAWKWLGDHIFAKLGEIKDHIVEGWNSTKKTTQDAWNGIKQWIGAAWDSIVRSVKDALHNFTSAIGNATKPARDAIGNVVDAIKKGIQVVIDQARDWGHNMLQMFIDGIKDKLGALRDMVGNAAGVVARGLGFHSPPAEGPLADSDTYMPNMMRMFSRGITDHLPTLRSALDGVTSLTSARLTGLSSSVSVAYAGGGGIRALGGGGGGAQVVIPITLDGKQIAQYTLDMATGQLRQAGMTRYVK